MRTITRRLACLIALAAVVGLGTSSARAAIIFSDNFNTENGGVEALNYTGFANWDVLGGGTVDLIGNGGTFDFLPGNGLYVDLDGSTFNAGQFKSKAAVSFPAGNFVLEFDLAGSQRGTTETVTVTFGAYAEVFVVPTAQGFTTITRNVTLNAGDMLSFQNAGGDNIGALLDNVRVSDAPVNPVPEPTSLSLLALGMAGYAARAWRRSRR